MCGIIGYYSETPQAIHYGKIAGLFEQSKIRGTHSFGISFIDPATSSIVTEKHHCIDEAIAAVLAIGEWEAPPKLLIGHNRYSTSGDWRDIGNNQPLHLNPGKDSEMSLAFNGVIDMRDPVEWEGAHHARFQTKNDGEIFINKYVQSGDPIEFVRRPNLSFAGVFICEGLGYALRNAQRPGWIALSDRAMFIASTRDIIARSMGCQVELLRELKPLRLMSFPYILQKMIEAEEVDHAAAV